MRKDGTDKTLFFHTDHLGSTDTISDSTGASFTQHFDPFGAPVAPPNPEITRVGFTGQDQDVDLGFTDMKGRMYDPLAGRFASADPVMQAPFWSQGLNRYSYAFNDPINNTDPSGFESIATWLGAAAFAVGDVALLCAGTGACGGLGGVLDLGINLGTTGLNGFPGAARPGMSFSGPVPTAAPAASGVSPGSPQAVGANTPVGPPLAFESGRNPFHDPNRLAQAVPMPLPIPEPIPVPISVNPHDLYNTGKLIVEFVNFYNPLVILDKALDALDEATRPPEYAPAHYQILDGVRRAKAAELLLGNPTVRAVDISTKQASDVPIDSLLSPKPLIDLQGAGMGRWLNALRDVRAGGYPPILVTPGNVGIPLRAVVVR